jgi:UPF0755 protein
VRRPLGIALLALAIVLAAVVVLSVHAWNGLASPLTPGAVPQPVRIRPGTSFHAIRAQLITDHILSPRAPLELYARFTGADREIRAGTYALSAALSPLELLRVLRSGQVVVTRVTIPEGLTCDRVFEILGARLDVAVDRLRDAANDRAYLDSLGLPPTGVEGYLFPDTYFLEPGIGASAILEALVTACLEKFDPARRARAAALGLTVHQVLTLASIIETESADSLERHRISAVYHNRLREGWRLQADPTVAYALGRPGQALRHEDLSIDSPFNTYVHAGLPPAPICSPGRASIDAALWPLNGCGDFFFVAGIDGKHVFSRSLAEHNGRVRAIRR